MISLFIGFIFLSIAFGFLGISTILISEFRLLKNGFFEKKESKFLEIKN